MPETSSILSSVNPCTIYTRLLVEKVKYLEDRGYIVVQIWECDIKRELERDEEMRCYFDNYEIVDPLEPRDAFFGGRKTLPNFTTSAKRGRK